jgi:hypothetical protein
MSDSSPFIGDNELWDWIAQRHEIPRTLVETVLALEVDFMVGVGVVTAERLVADGGLVAEVDARSGLTWRSYEPAELEGVAAIIDIDRRARYA